jgi:hypothetical protein
MMPTFAYSSKVRAVSDDSSLVLSARHCFIAGRSSDKLYNIKQSRIPVDVDVIAHSNLTLTISGVLDRVKVSVEDIAKSAVAHHLVNYLRTVRFIHYLSSLDLNLYLSERCWARPGDRFRHQHR